MEFSTSQLLAWLVVGVIVGSFTGTLVARKKDGLGTLANAGLGLTGALIGGLIFHIFEIDLGLSGISISAEDLVSAFIGSMVFLLGLWVFGRIRR